MSNLHDFLRTRRSIRNFLPAPVDDAIITKILETSLFAPSAHHRQPWRFVVLRKPGIRMKLADRMGAKFQADLEKDGLTETEISKRVNRSRERIVTTPAIVLLCMDASEMDEYADDRRAEAERAMAVQSTALAGLQLMLAAHAEGLGSVWTCSPLFAPEIIQEVLELDATWEPQAFILLGYPADKPGARERKSLASISKWL